MQGKGAGFPPMQTGPCDLSELWPALCEELQDMTGHGLGLEQDGGIHICLSQEEYDDRKEKLDLLRSHQNGRFAYEMLDSRRFWNFSRIWAQTLLVAHGVHPTAHVNPLYLLRSLHDGFLRHGDHVHADAEVDDISFASGIFTVTSRQGQFRAPQLVLAAGLGNKKLAPWLGCTSRCGRKRARSWSRRKPTG